MQARLRRMLNPAWWHAHRMELPNWYDVVFAASVFCTVVCLCYVGYAYSLYREGKDADMQRTRVIDACNSGGKISLGSYLEKDGSQWAIVCNFSERRVKT